MIRRSFLGLVLCCCGMGVIGCGPKAKLREDPFHASLGNPAASLGGGLSDRDTAREVSTSPTTSDPFLGSRSTASEPASSNAATKGDPPPRDAGVSFAGGEASAEKETSPKAGDYERARDRLEQAGARNIRLEMDEETGETFFRCEVPHPDDPSLLRVFEARHDDDVKSMHAVAEAIETWKTNLGPKGS
ncbi:hypothetical protein Pan216_58320 [Planctomycetes bacterium Pan216]|uniref:Uncharacterized protein n=1 Tax=Kolteria novifilia TaxID=2527975 RepID=A0A518BD84_9BACT|nr:hypothetical protein Pan216_58320 [Planctomycetes bacterium Pan216]